MRLQLAAPYDWAACVQDGVAGPGICGSWIFASGRTMTVIIEAGIGLHLKYLPDSVVQRDSLRPRGLEVIDKVDYRVPVRCPWILVESGALMCHKDNVRPSAILEKVKLSHDFLVVEYFVEKRGAASLRRVLADRAGVCQGAVL